MSGEVEKAFLTTDGRLDYGRIIFLAATPIKIPAIMNKMPRIIFFLTNNQSP
jgi:hypothetical protein